MQSSFPSKRKKRNLKETIVIVKMRHNTKVTHTFVTHLQIGYFDKSILSWRYWYLSDHLRTDARAQALQRGHYAARVTLSKRSTELYYPKTQNDVADTKRNSFFKCVPAAFCHVLCLLYSVFMEHMRKPDQSDNCSSKVFKLCFNFPLTHQKTLYLKCCMIVKYCIQTYFS